MGHIQGKLGRTRIMSLCEEQAKGTPEGEMKKKLDTDPIVDTGGKLGESHSIP